MRRLLLALLLGGCANSPRDASRSTAAPAPLPPLAPSFDGVRGWGVLTLGSDLAAARRALDAAHIEYQWVAGPVVPLQHPFDRPPPLDPGRGMLELSDGAWQVSADFTQARLEGIYLAESPANQVEIAAVRADRVRRFGPPRPAQVYRNGVVELGHWNSPTADLWLGWQAAGDQLLLREIYTRIGKP